MEDRIKETLKKYNAWQYHEGLEEALLKLVQEAREDELRQIVDFGVDKVPDVEQLIDYIQDRLEALKEQKK